MSWRRDIAIGLRTLAVQQTLQAQQLEHAKESIAELAAAVRGLQAEINARSSEARPTDAQATR